jgi:predicted transcriptional regulator
VKSKQENETRTVRLDADLIGRVDKAKEETGITVKALVEQGIKMRLDALAKEKR